MTTSNFIELTDADIDAEWESGPVEATAPPPDQPITVQRPYEEGELARLREVCRRGGT